MTLAVNQAMASHHPAKAVVRSWWVEAAREHKDQAVHLGVPMYLTLPGEEGYDVLAMIDAGLVSTNESGGIAEDDARLVVGYEKHMPTLASLKNKIPGLAVRPCSVSDALGGAAPEAAPQNKSVRTDFRATVVNLDMNESIKPNRAGAWEVPQLISKIGLVHIATSDRSVVSPWTLCITLRAEFYGDPNFKEDQIGCLRDASSSTAFASFIKQRAPWITADYVVSIESDRTRIQMAVLMVTCVHVVEILSAQGWTPKFRRAGFYQHDSPGSAPMVTLVVDLTFAGLAKRAEARKLAHQSLQAAWCWIDATGKVSN